MYISICIYVPMYVYMLRRHVPLIRPLIRYTHKHSQLIHIHLTLQLFFFFASLCMQLPRLMVTCSSMDSVLWSASRSSIVAISSAPGFVASVALAPYGISWRGSWSCAMGRIITVGHRLSKYTHTNTHTPSTHSQTSWLINNFSYANCKSPAFH